MNFHASSKANKGTPGTNEQKGISIKRKKKKKKKKNRRKANLAEKIEDIGFVRKDRKV